MKYFKIRKKTKKTRNIISKKQDTISFKRYFISSYRGSSAHHKTIVSYEYSWNILTNQIVSSKNSSMRRGKKC